MTRNHAIAVVMAATCTLLPLAASLYGDHSSGWLMVDFRAYYCAASAAAHGANPYYASSLHACESSPPAFYYRVPANLTVPAPYPPYVLMLLYPLTLLPFGIAAIVWWAILVLCAIVATHALSRITRRPLLIAWATLALTLVVASLPSGNMVVVCVAALLIAALSVQQGHFIVAALAIALSAVEPQLALPAALAAFIRFPSVRLVLVLLFALLAAGSLVQGGLGRSIEYVTSVLPAHALAEVSRDNQYSLSTVVAALGASDERAVLIGHVSYVIAALVGIIVGLRLARDYREPGFVLLVPPAFALLGGSFVHTGEFAIAAPACWLLFARAEAARPRLVLAALLLLAVPWLLATSAAMFLAPLFPVAYLVYVLAGRDRTVALASAVGCSILIAGLFALASHPAIHPIPRTIAHPPIDRRLAEASWRTLVLGNSTNSLTMWLLRLPTWLGIIAFAVGALGQLRRPLAAKV